MGIRREDFPPKIVHTWIHLDIEPWIQVLAVVLFFVHFCHDVLRGPCVFALVVGRSVFLVIREIIVFDLHKLPFLDHRLLLCLRVHQRHTWNWGFYLFPFSFGGLGTANHNVQERHHMHHGYVFLGVRQLNLLAVHRLDLHTLHIDVVLAIRLVRNHFPPRFRVPAVVLEIFVVLIRRLVFHHARVFQLRVLVVVPRRDARHTVGRDL